MPWSLEDYPASLQNFTRPVRRKAIEIANTLVEEAGHDDAKALAIATSSAKEWARNRGITIRADGQDTDVKAPAIHVVPSRAGGWAVRREADSLPIARYDDREDARRRGLALAREDNTDVVLHRRDGTIADRISRRREYHPDAAWHVVPAPDGWDVRREGAETAHRHCPTKRAALAAGREVARNQRGRLVIHRSDGRVQQEHAYAARPARR
ncbi:MAG: DUF2188 domain-containing protein [bacterium]